MPPRGRFVVPAVLLVALAAAACTGGGATPGPTGSGPAASPSAPPSSGVPSSPPTASATTAPSVAASSPPAVATGWRRFDGTSGPGSREDHTWTVQPESGTAWLFGGRDGPDEFNDLWRLDLDTDEWQRIEPVPGAGPEPRFGHTATWVTGIGLVVWSGQGGPTTFFDDLWAFDPDTGAWSELPSPGDRPPARYGSCAALGPDNRLWVSHGFTQDAGRFSDTWAYDLLAGRWARTDAAGEVPAVRCLHDCLWTPDGWLVLYAGQTTGIPAIGDLWARAVDGGWTEAPAEGAPPARQLYALTAAGSTAWVFGGGGTNGKRLGDLWTLDLSSLAWAPLDAPGDGPSARSGATLVADPDRGRLLLFGGLTDDGTSSETWELGLGTLGG